MRTVKCAKLGKDLPGLDEVPFEGHPLGQKIYDSISQDAWNQWKEYMKILMNEYRLNLANAEAQEFLLQQMEEFLFGKGNVDRPPDYVPPTE